MQKILRPADYKELVEQALGPKINGPKINDVSPREQGQRLLTLIIDLTGLTRVRLTEILRKAQCIKSKRRA